MFVLRLFNLRHLRQVRRNMASFAFHHPSWRSNRPVEYWCYNGENAVSKLIALKDLKDEGGALESELLNDLQKRGSAVHQFSLKNKEVSRWYLFPERDEDTIAVLSDIFGVTIHARQNKTVSREQVDFILGPTREQDHLILCVNDLRLQENDGDGVHGDVDDVAWLQACLQFTTQYWH